MVGVKQLLNDRGRARSLGRDLNRYTAFYPQSLLSSWRNMTPRWGSLGSVCLCVFDLFVVYLSWLVCVCVLCVCGCVLCVCVGVYVQVCVLCVYVWVCVLCMHGCCVLCKLCHMLHKDVLCIDQ